MCCLIRDMPRENTWEIITIVVRQGKSLPKKFVAGSVTRNIAGCSDICFELPNELNVPYSSRA